MKLSNRLPLWKWFEIVDWLYRSGIIIKEEEIVENAAFIENINAVLEGRDPIVRKFRQKLLKELENLGYQSSKALC